MTDLDRRPPKTNCSTLVARPDGRPCARRFGVDSDMQVPAFSERDSHVPDFDEAYRFDPQTTLAICAGLAYDRRVMIQGYHGTGKSTHIEQVAARLNWPMIRVNLDSHVSADRPGRQGRHRAARGQAGHRVPRRHAALGAAAADGAGVRRIRRRPAGRDVRDPAGAGGAGQADPARPEPGDPAEPATSACSRPPTPSALATPPASITAPSRSIRARWTAGRSSPR